MDGTLKVWDIRKWRTPLETFKGIARRPPPAARRPPPAVAAPSLPGTRSPPRCTRLPAYPISCAAQCLREDTAQTPVLYNGMVPYEGSHIGLGVQTTESCPFPPAKPKVCPELRFKKR